MKEKRRTVEIYFVLYLAALIFILPDGEKRENSPRREESFTSVAADMTLRAAKSALYCRIRLTENGPRLISLDSTNTIFYSGELEDVDYEFTIEDRSGSGRLALNTDDKSSTNFFAVEKNPDNSSATFKWRPPIFDKRNKSYLVEVTARGKRPLEEGDSERFVETTLKTQFTLNLIFVGIGGESEELLASIDTADTLPTANPVRSFFGSTLASQISLQPSFPTVKTFYNHKWSNRILALGMDPRRDLKRPPTIEIRSEPDGAGGYATLGAFDSGGFEVTGGAPSLGKMKVTVTIETTDDRKATTSFTVALEPIYAPEFASVMRPGKTYEIDPKLPFLPEQETRALLMLGDRILKVSEQGEKFNFTPEEDFVGKTLRFERYVNDKLLDKSYSIKIEDYPPPEIIDVYETEDEALEVKTRSYGYHRGLANDVALFEVDGNAEYRDLRGRYREDEQSEAHIQVFRFEPKNSDKPFRFSFRAVDRKGRESQRRSWP